MKIITSIAMAMTLSMAVSVAQAQTTVVPTEKPFRVAVGVYNPVGGAIKSAMGSSIPMISFSYDAGKTTSERPVIYGVYLDFAQNHRQGTNNSVTAFGVSGRYLSRAPVTSGRYFGGAGIGSYDVKLGSSNSKVGGKLFGGYEHNNGYFGEITYHMINKINGSDPSAVSFVVGRRF